MSGVLRLDWREYTLRQFLIMHDACVMDEWNRTTTLNVQLNTILTLLSNVFSKRKRNPLTYEQLHPYINRKPRTEGMKITPDNIGILKHIFSRN